MAITLACEKCGTPATVPDKKLGQTGRCAGCGHLMIIRPAGARPAGAVAGPGPLAPPAATFRWRRVGSVAFVVLVVLGGVGRGLKALRQGWAPGRPAVDRAGPDPKQQAAAIRRVAAGYATGPIELPRLPDLGPGREIEPGVMFHEVVLGPPDAPLGGPPGLDGKLWIYLPAGEHPGRSLPCILNAPAGTTLMTGNALGDADADAVHPERIPYVKAGFAVVAFELDGHLADETPGDREMGEAMIRFLTARAGLVNAHVALEYALGKLPMVDPARITAAGHSSAGTLAVLFAEREPRLRSAVAFAPALDLEKRFGPEAVARLKATGVGDLAVRYSPRNDVDALRCPLFLFHARDDTNVDVGESEAFAADLKARGKAVTLEVVAEGNHYQSMIREGIPRAIAWLRGKPAAEAVPEP